MKIRYHKDDVSVEMAVKNGRVWLTQKDMAKLLAIGINKVGDMINEHLSLGNITDNDIIKKSVVQAVSCRRMMVEINYYNMNVVRNVVEDNADISGFEEWLDKQSLQ